MTTGARTTWLISIVWSLCIAGSVEGATGTRSELPHAGQIAITLSTSRAQVSVGSGFGVAADVENVSDKTVYFNCGYFVMTPPLEIDPDGPYAWWAYMQGNQNNKTFYTDAIALEPGDKTVAFWAGTSGPTWPTRRIVTGRLK